MHFLYTYLSIQRSVPKNVQKPIFAFANCTKFAIFHACCYFKYTKDLQISKIKKDLDILLFSSPHPAEYIFFF